MAPSAPARRAALPALMDEHHYLGTPTKTAQTVWHATEAGSGAQPALATFCAAALKCGAYDARRRKKPRKAKHADRHTRKSRA